MLRFALVIAAGSVLAVTFLDDLRPGGGAQDIALVQPSARDLRPGGISICSGGDRVTCIVDGDTGWLDGEKWRLVARSGGVDAPELSKPECASERAKASVARDRLRSLMSGGYAVERDGEDRNGRALVRITLADGRDAGDALIREGLAQAWPNHGNVWCRR